MDIARMSISMSQGSLASAVQMSLMKIQMNTGEEAANGLKQMMDTMAVDTSKGNVIDVRV